MRASAAAANETPCWAPVGEVAEQLARSCMTGTYESSLACTSVSAMYLASTASHAFAKLGR
eukprot:12929349-Prorocentrum_lima.AAC.1